MKEDVGEGGLGLSLVSRKSAHDQAEKYRCRKYALQRKKLYHRGNPNQCHEYRRSLPQRFTGAPNVCARNASCGNQRRPRCTGLGYLSCCVALACSGWASSAGPPSCSARKDSHSVAPALPVRHLMAVRHVGSVKCCIRVSSFRSARTADTPVTRAGGVYPFR